MPQKTPFSYFHILVHLVVSYYSDSGRLKTDSINDLNRGVSIAQDIWNIALSISERHMIDAMRAPSYARKFFEKKVLPYFDLDDCLSYPNNIYICAMIRNTRLRKTEYGDMLEQLYTITRNRFEWESHILDVPEAVKQEVYKKLKNPSWDALDEGDIMSLVYQILDHSPRKDIAIIDIQPWMRELQALMNHTPYEKLGYVVSRYTFNCYEELSLIVEKEEVDISGLVVNTLDAHESVGRLMTLWKESETRYIEHLKSIAGDSESMKKLIERHEVAINPEIAGILHHMIDWYIRTLPWHMRRRSPRQILTGVILGLTHLYHTLSIIDSKGGERNWDIYLLLPSEDIVRQEFLENKGWSSVRQDSMYFQDEFREFFSGDLSLMFPKDIDGELIEKLRKQLNLEHAV